MVCTEGRLEVKLNSHDLFATLMQHNGYTVRSLAEAVEKDLRKTYKRRLRNDPTAPAECSKSTIGNLRSGYRNSVHPDTAAAIADRLEMPMEALFSRRVSTVYRDRPNAA